MSQDRETDSLGELVGNCDLSRWGIDPADVADAHLVHDGHGGRVYRIVTARGPLILKWFRESAQANEARCYALLQTHGVPTLATHGWAEDAILLEDLESSSGWRPATADDVESPGVGVAVAEWYRALHAAGRRVLASPEETPAFLQREADALTPAVVLETGRKLGLAADPIWRLAAASVEALAEAMRALPETLTYSDFHWSNLALSRQQGQPLQAIVYDYHQLGIGLAYSDCRNVTSALKRGAAAAFTEAYGPVDEQGALLYEPVSVLFGLSVAARRPQLPAWSEALLRTIESGQFERDLRRATEALQAR